MSLNENKILWSIRLAQQSDIPFIYSTWLKSFKHDSELGKSMRSSVFFEDYRTIIDNILLNSEVYIACLQDESEVILGFLVANESVFHYCFIKQTFRRMGIARSLFEKTKFFNKINLQSKSKTISFTYTHKTGYISKFDILKPLTYNPLLLFRR